MKKRFLPILLLSLVCALSVSAQTWAIHLNGNETYPIWNELRSQHPILWPSKAQGKIVFGGYGLGVSNTRPWKGKTMLRFQANAQRSRFYDIPTIVRDENGQPLGAVIGTNTNYGLSLLSVAMVPLDKLQRWKLGAGLGLRGLVFAQTKYKVFDHNFDETDVRLRNKSMSPVVLLLPLAGQVNLGRFSVEARAEFAVTRVNRLEQWAKERSMVFFLELGYRLGSLDGQQ